MLAKALFAVFLFCAVTAAAQPSQRQALAQPLAVTFDDLPAHGAHPPAVSRLQIMESILATLRREKLPPTYGFLNGVKTEEHPETMEALRAWRAAGQPLANHTWSHADFNETLPYQFEAEIEANQPMLRTLMPGPADDWHWFRYPYLNEGDTVEKHRTVRAWLKANHYQIAEVTMDFEDYLWNEPYTRCVAKHDDTAVRQLHDTYLATADEFITYYRDLSKAVYGRQIPLILLMHVGAFDAQMLPDLLSLYRKRGFTFVSLPEAANDPVYAEDPDQGYTRGDTLTEQLAFKKKMALSTPKKPMALLQSVCR